MNGVYIAVILFWPYSTGNSERDRKAVGEERRKFKLTAQDFDDAYKQLQILLTGIKTNPDLWMAVVESLAYKKLGED